jgi:hypothetical protein
MWKLSGRWRRAHAARRLFLHAKGPARPPCAFLQLTTLWENGMLSGWCRASVAAYVTPALLIGPAAFAQAGTAWIDPPAASVQQEQKPLDAPLNVATPRLEADGRIERKQLGVESPRTSDASASTRQEVPASSSEADPAAFPMPVDRPIRLTSMKDPLVEKKYAARDLAFTYLNRWSAPNSVTLASAASFYGPSVHFHGQTRSRASLIAEKRRFAERWPDRSYRYRPETTQISCEADGARCTVWSIFDYTARHPQKGRRSRGIGTHEIVVSFSGSTPVIASEDSRVLDRGGSRR